VMQFGWRTFEDFFGNPEPDSLQNQFPSNHCMHNLMLYLPTLPTHSCGVHYSYLIITLDTCHPRWTFTLIWQLSPTDLANVFAKYSPLHGLTLPSRFHCLIAWPRQDFYSLPIPVVATISLILQSHLGSSSTSAPTSPGRTHCATCHFALLGSGHPHHPHRLQD